MMKLNEKNPGAGKLNELRETLNALRNVSGSFNSDAEPVKKTLLHKIASCKIHNPKIIFEYHQLLLFHLAYPQSKELLNTAQHELNRMAAEAQAGFYGTNKLVKLQLTNTGIANTQINVSFSFHFVKWLVTEFREAISLFSIDAGDTIVEQVLSACLQPVSRDLIADKMLSPLQMIHRLKKSGKDDLKFLVQLFDGLDCSPEIRDALWDSMKIFVTWKLHEHAPSLTNAKSPDRKIFFQRKSLIKSFDFKTEIGNELPPSVKLNGSERKQLIIAARGVLSMFLRETDPVTYVDERDVELFDAGRGIDIALYPMIAERRLPLESYIGYVAFRNRIPVAYGGGWIFLHRSKIGINVFPAFRGGESAFIFCQILRVYHHHFNVKKFIAEPYQIGKNNNEGLKSGAFWFYYRIGFRPGTEKLKQLARKEFEMIRSDKSYRSPLSVMRQLSEENLELDLSPNENYVDIDPLLISEKVNGFITKNNGKDWMKDNHLAEILSDTFGLKRGERKILTRLFKRKFSGGERDFILLSQKETELFRFLQREMK